VLREHDPKELRLSKQGTTALSDIMNTNNILPVNNYKFGTDEREKRIFGKVFEDSIFEQKYPDGCFAGCNLACTKACENYQLLTGPFKGKTVAVDGPEYETAAAVTNLGIFDIPSILEYAWYCDEYAMDTVYAAKGYVSNSIPTDETLQRLGFEDKEFFQIVKAARQRVAG